jgi:hypothetical protein
MLLFLILREVLTLLLLESLAMNVKTGADIIAALTISNQPVEPSGYQGQDGIERPQNYSIFSFLGSTQMLLHILQGQKASENEV